jgi:tetratricopeptide (TPR) repeat protein
VLGTGAVAVDRVQRLVEGGPGFEPAPSVGPFPTGRMPPATRGQPVLTAPRAPSPRIQPTAGPEKDYADAVQAAAGKDCPTALAKFEAALAADPDSLRYASDYRMAVISCAQYDRAIVFFGQLTAAHPGSANAVLNHGYAYVDKIPTVGAVTQVILANTALGLFSKSIELKRTWLALYTRGNSYLYWPTVFGRAPLGVADLEAAVAMSKAGEKWPYHARAYIALGDGYWKLGQIDKARATWQEGVRLFPEESRLRARLAAQGDALKALIEGELDPAKRVDTDLRAVWLQP